MNEPQTIITCPNPKCARQHGLFWYIAKGGKRHLMYRCNKVVREGRSKHGDKMPVLITANLMAPAGVVPADDLPEEWTIAASQEVQDKAQRQFPLMK